MHFNSVTKLGSLFKNNSDVRCVVTGHGLHISYVTFIYGQNFT